ncbi:DUF58 domain-containing protein [Leucobacter viscericola]|uniref:DUF58 domain-containing protein n=1 Tax=Leucobacter viscericola TaxID=2714935 RepID=A0A6G7XEZ9_9MICO|nr:DUF58 domain-containing protein [Leucobacter viscericola]QIK63046.1 DUF58 domain-containing protein [Leucobacter viscericola]
MNKDTSRAPLSRTGTRSRTFGTTQLQDTGRGVAKAGSGKRRLKRWWRRNRRQLSRLWRRVTRTITPTGWFVIFATATAAILGATLNWVEAWFVAIVGAVLLLVGLPFLLGSRAYLIRIVVDRMRVVAGGAVNLSIEVENSSARPALPATAEMPVGEALRRIPIPFISPQGSVVVPAAVAATARGVIEVGPMTLSRRDPLGLMQRKLTWRDRHLIHVHPRTVFLPPGTAGLVRDLDGAASRRLTDSDLSFHAVREYVQGDAMRHVHWKSTAKTGTLMVRQYEESQTARSAILFDANRTEYASDEEFELGVSVAASVSMQAVREARESFVASQWSPGRLRPSIDGLEELPSQTLSQLLDAWAELEVAEEALPIERLARGLAESRRPLSIVVIVTGSIPDPTRLRRAAASFPEDVTVLAIRCEVLADPASRLLDVCTLFTVGALGDLPQLMLRGVSA